MIRLMLMMVFSGSMAACTTIQTANPTSGGVVKTPLAFNGNINTSYEEKGQAKRNKVDYDWLENQNESDIKITTTLGIGLARIKITPKEASIKTVDGHFFVEPTVEDLTERLLGFEIPFSLMRQAVGVPDQPLKKNFTQNGWAVSVQETFANPNLAKLISIKRTLPTPIDVRFEIEHRSDQYVSEQKPSTQSIENASNQNGAGAIKFDQFDELITPAQK